MLNSAVVRTFRDLSEEEVADIEKASFLSRLGWQSGITWDDVLYSERVLIVSEAGAGKTYECRTQQERLWSSGEPAFFLDLATLAETPLDEMFSAPERLRYESWRTSQSDVATFFL